MDRHEASWDQQIRIANGALLESHPQWTIPQAESRFRQTTRMELSPGSRLFFIEAIAPGRLLSANDSFSSIFAADSNSDTEKA